MQLRRTLRHFGVALALVSLAGASAVAADDVESRDPAAAPAPGVVHQTLSRGDAVAHVATISREADASLQVVPAGQGVGAVERTSALCRRVSCLVAVNGDFRLPGTNLPVGGVVTGAELLRSPSSQHHQLSISREGRLSAGSMSFRVRLVPTDLDEVRIDAVNVAREDDVLVLYTDAAGASTRSNPHGVEIALSPVDPEGVVRLDQTTLMELGSIVEGVGDLRIPRGGAVLSGHGTGAARLRDLAARIGSGDAARQALVRVETEPSAAESVGGTPVLIKDGRRWFTETPTQFVSGRHPRTAVGWNDGGDAWLVAVDGRRPDHSVGMTLGELADFMLELGATDAINLDGGGTSTFVAEGEVLNRPSDQFVERSGVERIVQAPGPGDVVINDSVERPTVNALAVVASDRGTEPLPDPLTSDRLDLPVLPTEPPLAARDPASVPGASLPALVGSAPPATGPLWMTSLVAAAAAGAAITLAIVTSRTRWRRRRLS